jgi:hypothetical protein
MSTHPVQLHIERTERVPRIQVAIRLVLVLALGIVSWSAIYWLLYLALPALVALELSHKGGDQYAKRDAPRLVRGLKWLAGAYAFLSFLTDVLPTTEEGDGRGPVDLHVDVASHPTVRSALLRLVTSLPALLLVAVLSVASWLGWLMAAGCALVNERIPPALAEFLTVVLRVKLRLIAYHLSLVDRYPSLEGSSLEPAPNPS